MSARQLLAQSPAKLLHCAQQQTPLCTAVLPIGPDVVVVWATTPGDFEAGSARVRWLMAHTWVRNPVLTLAPAITPSDL